MERSLTSFLCVVINYYLAEVRIVQCRIALIIHIESDNAKLNKYIIGTKCQITQHFSFTFTVTYINFHNYFIVQILQND
jgi:hypothetical protein